MKKRMYIIASVCVALGILWTGMGSADANKVYAAESVTAGAVGDVNGDAVRSTDDVTSMLTELVQGTAVDTANDTNVDAVLNIKDLMRLQRYVTPADTTWLNEENKKTDSDGTEYYEITNFAELYGLSTVADCDKTIRLAEDIVLNVDGAFKTSDGKVYGVYEAGLVRQWTPIENFTGTFDGQGHTVSGLFSKTAGGTKGFFGVADNATIQDFRMTHSYIYAYGDYTGSIAGQFSGTMQNVYSDAYVGTNSAAIGGLVGVVKPITDGSSSISGCWFDGTLYTTKLYAGGIAGSTDSSGSGTVLTMANCLVSGTLSTDSNAYQNATLGGLLGGIRNSNDDVTISDSLFDGVLDPTLEKADGSTYSYRFVGYMLGTIEGGTVKLSNTYSTATSSYAGPVGRGVAGIGYSGVAADNITGTATALATAADTFTGINADVNTDLDFATSPDSEVPTWIVQEGTYPILGWFADMATAELLYVSWYYDADGTAEDPYVIDTAYDLSGFNYMANNNGETFEGKYVQLATDICLNDGDAADWGTTAPENVWTPIKNFKGTFDGDRHTISGVYVNGTNKQGFFGTVTEGTIKDMRITNSYISASSYGVGSVAGYFSGTLENVYSDATVVGQGEYTGGLVGVVTSSNISCCWFNGTLDTSNLYAGGIAGATDSGVSSINLTMNNNLVTGKLSTSNDKYRNAVLGGMLGGIRASSHSVTISDSLFAGVLNPTLEKTDGSTYSYRYVGYMIGASEGGTVKLSNTYSTATVSWTTNMQSWGGAASGCPTVTGIGYNSVAADNITGTATTLATTADTFTGINADINTDLDFATSPDSAVPTWIVREGTYPILGCFADMATEELLYVNWYCDAEGTDADPYVLDTTYDLYSFNSMANDENMNFAGKTVQLGADIALNEGNSEAWGTKAPENVWTPINNFKGTFDGQGHTISGVYVNGTNKQGFFATVAEGTIKDMRITNSYISASSYGVGSVAGYFSGTLENVYSDATVVGQGEYTGGLVGVVTSGNISGCWFDGTLDTSNLYVGGIAGATDSGVSSINLTMKNNLVTGKLSTSNGKYRNATLGGMLGGIRATSHSVTISDSLFAGEFKDNSVDSDGNAYTYRFVGYMLGALEAGSVDLSNTYSAAAVSWSTDRTIDYSGADSTVDKVTGIGYNSVAAENITGATTMQTSNEFVGENATTYTNLDFTTPYWVTVPNRTPVLKAFDDLVEESDITVMSYNIRSGNMINPPDPDYKLWENRKDYVLAGIIANNPTILCLQEIDAYESEDNVNRYEYLCNQLSLLPEPYAATNQQDSEGYALSNQIFYKSDLYTKEEEGSFGLLESYTDHQRYCIYAVLQDKATQNKFLVATTHWPADTEDTRREECSKKIIDTLPTIMKQHGVTSVILTGDFNGTAGNTAVSNLATNLSLLNCKDQTINTIDTSIDVVRSLNNWGTPVNTIDHVFISNTGLFNVKYFNHDNTMYGDDKTLYASDHFPVIVGLDF